MSYQGIDKILDSVRPYFPLQGPIKDFLHFNALAGFQNVPFDKAVELASELYGAHSYMSLGYYKNAYQRGQVNEVVLNRKIAKLGREKNVSGKLVAKALFEYVEVHDANVYFELVERAGYSRAEAVRVLQRVKATETKRGSHFVKMRQGFVEQIGLEVDPPLNTALFRVVSGFLDQGITLWQFPAHDIVFYEAVKQVVQQSYLPIAPFARRASMLAALKFTPNEVIETLLEKIVGDKRFYESYVRDTLIAHIGWSGLVNYLESKPSFLLRERRISLKEFLAFKLILEWEFISTHRPDFVPLALWSTKAENHHELEVDERRALSFAWLKLQEPELSDQILFDARDLRQLWHEALETSAYRELLTALKVHDGNTKNANRPKSSVQAIFCLDDCECSFRRYLEELDPTIETFGSPGFFGVDFFFQSLNDSKPIQLCPPVLSPKHVVGEVVESGQEAEYDKQKTRAQKTALSFELWRAASSSLLLGFVAANTLGHFSVFHMLVSVLNPRKLAKSLKLRRVDVPTSLAIHRIGNQTDELGRFNGFTHEEMALRVENVLRGIGLLNGFARIVVALAHGATSVNNPHFAAYDCAACFGKSGAPNARSFAHMANLREVRVLLRERGVDIPEETFFVGGVHDTTTDFVAYFDLEKLSDSKRQEFAKFSQTVDRARGKNAQERCRRFTCAPLNISEAGALQEVSKRALAPFEPRAELGHATSYSCVIGRRDLTRGLFLDRRAFLNSYDPSQDKNGEILAQILSAAIPVCGTVNLDYYFSRIDPAKYGCGTKLSHNIVGLLGVCNGIDDDLRTGLPLQMTELHDPIKLLLVIEQETEIISHVLRENAHLAEWVQNSWVRVASVSPSSGEVTICSSNLWFERFDVLGDKIPTFASSRASYVGQRENLPMARIQ